MDNEGALTRLRDILQCSDDPEVDLVLSQHNAASRDALLELIWSHIEQQGSQGNVDTRILRLCLKLLSEPQHRIRYFPRLCTYVLDGFPKELGHDRLYHIVEACMTNALFARDLFDEIFAQMRLLNDALTAKAETIVDQDKAYSVEVYAAKVGGCLNLLKTSYWLPPQTLHYITPESVQILVGLCRSDLSDVVHDVLSALLALLRRDVKILHPYDRSQPPCMISDHRLVASGYRRTLIAQQLWDMLKDLPDTAFTTNSSLLFRTWFQWTSHMRESDQELKGVYDPNYWDRIRIRLLGGFGEQRKYCLGILSHSLSLARHDIDTPFMQLRVNNRQAFVKAYGEFSNLFETIVLDRYANQVQACLPELTSLLGPESLIAPVWVQTLLSAALSSKTQDGIRKIMGQWFMRFAMDSRSASIAEYATFFVEGFLPWATQGSLFTSTLISNREHTDCTHGENLAGVTSKIVKAMTNASGKRRFLNDVLRSIIERGGKIFQHSIVYLLDGLLEGFTGSNSLAHLQSSDVQILVEVSRLRGLPEVASDLCTTYCTEFCRQSSIEPEILRVVPGYGVLEMKLILLRESQDPDRVSFATPSPSLNDFLQQLNVTHHKAIQNNLFVPACDIVTQILTDHDPDARELHLVLEALWDEAERQEFRRLVALKVPSLFLHPTCLRTVVQIRDSEEEKDLKRLLREVVGQLGNLAVARVYLLSRLFETIRTACVTCPRILHILPIPDLLLKFIQVPPLPKTEFLFEAAAAKKLQQYLPHRNYSFYYGKREWHAYASLVDLLVRLPDHELAVAKQLLRDLVEPWRTQKAPILVVSKWKNAFQLQITLLLTEFAIPETDAKWYLDAFQYALVVEPWPRFRFLLEWIICRIYIRYSQHTERLLLDLSNTEDADPRYIASLIKLAVLCAPFLDSEDFALQLLLKLIPFSASQKVHIRHESQWCFPIVWQLAEQRKWASIVDNPAFKVLNDHIRQLDRYSAYPSTIRTLHLDAVKDFTLTNIFQGDYLRVEPPERGIVAREDFLDLWREDVRHGLQVPTSRVPLGSPISIRVNPTPTKIEHSKNTTASEDGGPYQTKSGFDFESLMSASGSPSGRQKRPSPVILVASLIDNPTNLGGLSRISESFGLEALYIDSLSKTRSNEFQGTAVTSHKHLPIKELKPAATPDFLVSLKREGYTVVAVEQTDRSGILGDETGTHENANARGGKQYNVGTLPKKCVLVLGSEKGGVTPEVLAVVDRCVEIRTVGFTRSLNVQTAAGIVVYEWWREWGKQV
ncbi:hypothetical protein BDV96DRAFT_649927 [Lophiotrema nucula]|uniref:tRNA/rRNA methyltransferase SpoU type domain-containing protein n=1 Tax=Lophiotrema nucula TaxID=690887 RepID=A0A6A5YX38_9PLEO|nr:hypothetical protein BDV96DRAFT_649927 [Lophiotrema nucula]